MRKLTMPLCLVLCLVMVLGLAACGQSGDDPSAVEPPPFADEPEFVPEEESEPEPESVPEPESISEPEPEPESVAEPVSQAPANPPKFVEDSPAVSAKGNSATVTFKTDVASTVNCILTTSGAGVSTTVFYDYFNRGKALDGAVSKKQLFDVGSGGSSVTFDIPDATKGYFLLVNAAANEGGAWQSGVTVLTLFDPAKVPPSFSEAISQDKSSKAFTIKTNMPAIVYVIITDGKAGAPNAQQVKEGGTGYSGTKIYLSGSGTSKGEKAPYKLSLDIGANTLESGSYAAWFALQNNDGPLSEVGKMNFTI